MNTPELGDTCSAYNVPGLPVLANTETFQYLVITVTDPIGETDLSDRLFCVTA